MNAVEEGIFRGGSTTYYWAARLFPKSVRADVLKLYSFLRIADDYVDSVPPKAHQFHMLRTHWDHAVHDPHFDTTPSNDDTIDERVIKNIVGLTRGHAFDLAWVEALLDAMQADLDGKTYKTLDESLGYVYGSAEVVGLMMAKVMGLTPEAYETAKLQGRAMQWINFIRDIGEDTHHGRCYFPQTDLQEAGLPYLNQDMAQAHPEAFKKLVRLELRRYHEWQDAARAGFGYIPGARRTALKTAVDMFDWTAKEIKKDPFVVFRRRVRPAKVRVVLRGMRNIVRM